MAEPIVDGMSQVMGGMTNGVFVFNQLTFQEVVVETSGVGADRETGGMQLNIIQRDGGNEFSGGLAYSYTGPSLESDNITDELVARNLRAATVGGLKKYYDFTLSLGGPIERDRLWFFGSGRDGDNQQLQQGNYYNKLQGTLAFTRRRPSRPAADRPVVQGPHRAPDVAGRRRSTRSSRRPRCSRTAIACSVC